MTVYSTQLGAGAFAAGSYSTVYTVPTGKRTILKSMWLRNTFNGANIAKVNLSTVAHGNVYFYTNLATSGAAGDTALIPLWVVLNVGDIIKIEPTQSNVEAIFSGAELIL